MASAVVPSEEGDVLILHNLQQAEQQPALCVICLTWLQPIEEPATDNTDLAFI